MNATKKKGKGWTPDLRPARQRYWSSGTLRNRKAERLFATGRFVSMAEAARHWDSVRKGRVKTAKPRL